MMREMLISDEIEKEYEYKLDKRDRKPRRSEATDNNLKWFLIAN